MCYSSLAQSLLVIGQFATVVIRTDTVSHQLTDKSKIFLIFELTGKINEKISELELDIKVVRRILTIAAHHKCKISRFCTCISLITFYNFYSDIFS